MTCVHKVAESAMPGRLRANCTKHVQLSQPTTVSENLVTLQLSDFMMRKLQNSEISRCYNRIFIIGISITRIERKYKYYLVGLLLSLIRLKSIFSYVTNRLLISTRVRVRLKKIEYIFS